MDVWRVIRRLAVLLVLGAVLNVAVAWAIVVIPQPLSNPYRDFNDLSGIELEGDSCSMSRLTTRGLRILSADYRDWLVLKGWEPGGPGPGTREELIENRPIHALEAVTAMGIGIRHRGVSEVHYRGCFMFSRHAAAEVCSGWPVYSMRGECINVAPAVSRGVQWRAVHACLLKSPVTFRTYWSPSMIPLTPIWKGLVVNSVLYAAFLWLLLAGPSAVRQRWRQRQGLCRRCGYDLHGAAHTKCPECGLPVVSRGGTGRLASL